jgi:hypothetical protein
VRFPPVVVASVVLHLGVAVLAAALSPRPPRALLRPTAPTVDLDLAPPPPPPPAAPAPVVPPPTAAPPTPPPAAAARAAAARPNVVATATSTVLTAEGSADPVPVAVAPVEAVARDAGVALPPPTLRASALLAGARDLSLSMAGAQPTDAQRREEIRAVALAPIVEGLHANDHIDRAGTARASRVLSTRVAEEIAGRISAPALAPEVDRAPSIDLPAYRPSESAGERMAASELDAVHSNSFTSASFGPGSPACSSYHALLVDVAIADGDAGRPVVSLLRSSGVASLDRSVLEVAREVAAEASAPGTTRWRFELANDAGRCARWGGWRPLGAGDLRVRFRRMHGR